MKQLTMLHWFFLALILITILGAESLNRPTQQVLGKIAGTNTSLEFEASDSATQINWQKIAADHPNYIYAYLEMANLAWRNGDLTSARAYLDQAKSISPNHSQVILLDKIFN